MQVFMHGKTIELFLVNGTADSLVTAELSNWNGKAVKIPRNEVKDCTREDIRNAGVYFLICKDEQDKNAVYIGEAENVQERLIQHIRSDEDYYWQTAVAFFGNDLNKASIRYLEHRLVEIAKACCQYEILTKNTYKNTVLKESQIESMEEFIENIQILINTLGYKILEPKPNASSDTVYFYCSGKEANAKGFVSTNGFTVVKDSQITTNNNPSFVKSNYVKLQNQLIENKIIVNGKFVQDYEFASPSAAAAVILGRNSNGQLEWKTADKISMRDYEK